MNSTFKVIFNRVRGALMVVNEATSSVQTKGTKTVIAAAAAAMIAGAAGSAGAAALATEAVTITSKTSEMTVTGAVFDKQTVSGVGRRIS